MSSSTDRPSPHCAQIQRRCSEHGVAWLAKDADAQAHVDACDACTGVLDALQTLDATLRDLPPLASSKIDADHFEAMLTRAVEEAQAPVGVQRAGVAHAPTPGAVKSAPPPPDHAPRAAAPRRLPTPWLDGPRAILHAASTLVREVLRAVVVLGRAVDRRLLIAMATIGLASVVAYVIATGGGLRGGDASPAMESVASAANDLQGMESDDWGGERGYDDNVASERAPAPSSQPGAAQQVARPPQGRAGGGGGARDQIVEYGDMAFALEEDAEFEEEVAALGFMGGAGRGGGGSSSGAAMPPSVARPSAPAPPPSPSERPVADYRNAEGRAQAQERSPAAAARDAALREPISDTTRSAPTGGPMQAPPEPALAREDAMLGNRFAEIVEPEPELDRGWDYGDGDYDGRYVAEVAIRETSRPQRSEVEARRRVVASDEAVPAVTSTLSDDVLTRENQNQAARTLAAEAARAFLDARKRVDGVATRAARGYWANTYLPGDPRYRQLLGQVAERGTDAGRVASMTRPYTRPFDPPERAALDVRVHADVTGVQEPTRVLVSVDLQGARATSGRRPAMNVAVVLDMRSEWDADASAAARRVLASLSAARDVGDRFALVVAGRTGAVVIAPGDFTYGEVTVASEIYLPRTGAPEAGRGGLSIVDAYAEAVRLVADDEGADAMGGALVIMVAPSMVDGGTLPQLEQMAHDAAVEGIPTSVFSLASGSAAAERLSLAGQGSHRDASGLDGASRAVDAEMLAASRVVARAIRLRIRLAPGVQLVDVLGSYRLDEEETQRVREAEQSIDRRLSAAMGIASDRGEDEDGIQIVIPSFLAEDTHSILLDVIVPGGGPVVDVQARYKDVVFLRNGVARAHLALDRRARAPGQTERVVMKQYIGWLIASELDQAADTLSRGDRTEALSALRGLHTVLTGLPAWIPELQADTELQADIEIIRRLLSHTEGVSTGYDQQQALADALRLAGLRKARTPGADTTIAP